MSVNTFTSCLKEINSYLLQLLPPSNYQTPRDEIISIIKHCNTNYFNKLVEKDVQSQEHPNLWQIVK